WEREQIGDVLLVAKGAVISTGLGIVATGAGVAAASVAVFYTLKKMHGWGTDIAEDVFGKEAATIMEKVWERTTLVGWLFRDK
ncbi:MAG: hypothetical protein QGH13_05820, partial [Candidatus Thalassarchaeaceae archaeon]|nr:hypothetical protein [Candidatus Thalassarchaeaceae archaeon]